MGRLARLRDRDEAERRFLAMQSGLSRDARELARSLFDAASREE